MSDNAKIKQAVRDLAKDDESIYSIVCTVSSVNGKKCDCSPVNDDADLLEVRLMASETTGILVTPTVGSKVIVTMINKVSGYVSMFSEVDSIELNGSNYEGLVRVSEQTAKLNALVTELKAELVKIATGITGAGGAYTPGTLTSFNKNDYQNNTVKHGNG